MKIRIAATAAAAFLLGVGSKAPAQVVVSQPWSPVRVVEGPGNVSSTQVFPYSYYVTTPWPARGYVAYGPGDTFPFHGRPYGHPDDRWTWPYLGGGYSRYLARYYYPPVP